MYHDKHRNLRLIALIVVLVAAAALFLLPRLKTSASDDLNEESITAIRNSVERCALQCYVVEGAYPANLDYLISNYGLNINSEEYYVVYDAFAQNQLPDIRILKK